MVEILRIITEDNKILLGLLPPEQFAGGDFYIISSFGNSGLVETGDGLVLFDIGLRQYGRNLLKRIRSVSNSQIKYIIYSHGHFDHCFGYKHIVAEINENGWEMPEIIAHENCIKRFEKYKMLDKYHKWLNAQQFASIIKDTDKILDVNTLNPTIIIKDNEPYFFKLGKYSFEIYPENGETDDAIWMFCPEKKVAFTGDLMISSYPNVGNPFKVQRYPKDWAEALEKIADKNPEFLLPGHGKLIEGKDKIKNICLITAEALHFVHDEVVKRLNQGKWFEEIYHEMLKIYPDKFKNHPYLQPVYGCYQFAIHSVYRLYHGWYDTGNPTDLFPAKRNDIAKEIISAMGSGSEEQFLKHAIELEKENKHQLALHILDIIIDSQTTNNLVLLNAYKLKQQILKYLAKKEQSFIVKNILYNGARQIGSVIKHLLDDKANSD